MTKREYKNFKKTLKQNAKFAKKDATTKALHSADYSHLSEKHRAKMEKKDLKAKLKEQKALVKKTYKDSK